MSINKIEVNKEEENNKIKKIEEKLLGIRKKISKISEYISTIGGKTDTTDQLEVLLGQELSNEAQEKAQPLINKIKNQVLSKIHLLLDTVTEQSEYIEELLSQVNDNNIKKNKLQKDYDTVINENKALENLASTDLLTGLGNRRKLEYVIDILKSNIHKSNRGACFAMLDIDFFKNINTKYGIVGGDYALKMIGNYFREYFGNDGKYQYFRIGGEEFIVISVEKYDTFNIKIQKFLDFVSKKKIGFESIGKEDLNISFSAGTMYSRNEEGKVKSEDHIGTRLSDLLKLAKENGRNRIETDK